MNNRIMLITYADSMGKGFAELESILGRHFQGAVGGLHILPFFPSSGDRGFSPLCYDTADERFGTLDDVVRLGKKYDLMVDFMVNHISRQSPYFLDYLQKVEASPYKDFFVCYSDFWVNGEPTDDQLALIYKRKPKAPYYEAAFADGSTKKIWCTFSEEQMDLDVRTDATRAFFKDTLTAMCAMGASVIRLDAFAYAVKKPGTSCFFVEPEIWELLSSLQDIVAPQGTVLLPEIHEHYTIQHKLAEKGYWIYDFALPVLVLYTLYSGNGEKLKLWLEKSPMKQFTTLDTHDGIGIVDVKDLLDDGEIEYVKDKLFAEGANVKRIYNTAAYNNLDIYQINTTYYSALGNQDGAYLLARAIQFFAPGIPQVYYVGLLAGQNDLELLEKTKEGRNINRHYYSMEEIDREIERPIVRNLLELMRFRNRHPAFDLEGEIQLTLPQPSTLVITRKSGEHMAELTADLQSHAFTITCTGEGGYTFPAN